MQTFSTHSLGFLEQLREHNNREWFQANKAEYEAVVREPALAFIRAMQQPLAEIAPHFVADSRKSGGSLMRIYRDIRFSRDKTPYKTNIGMHFRHERGKDVHAPGYYLHISPEQVFVGVGIWRPDSMALGKIRTAIVEQPECWKKLHEHGSFSDLFELKGDRLKRPPRGFDAQHKCIDDLKRKDFIAGHDLDEADIFKPDFVQQVSRLYEAANPFMRFLCEALQLSF